MFLKLTLVALVVGIFSKQIIILKLESKEHCGHFEGKKKVSTFLCTSLTFSGGSY